MVTRMMIKTPVKKIPFLPILSRTIPEKGRMIREATVAAPKSQPRRASAPPKDLA